MHEWTHWRWTCEDCCAANTRGPVASSVSHLHAFGTDNAYLTNRATITVEVHASSNKDTSNVSFSSTLCVTDVQCAKQLTHSSLHTHFTAKLEFSDFGLKQELKASYGRRFTVRRCL